MKLVLGKFPEQVIFTGINYKNGGRRGADSLTVGKQYPVLHAGLSGQYGFLRIRNDYDEKFEYSARGFEEAK